MMHPNTIASLIQIRAFLEKAVDNLHIKLSREDVKNVQNKVAAIDKAIVEQALKLDFDMLKDESTRLVKEVKEYNFTNSEDVLKDIEATDESSEPAEPR